jgi:hypothetical protein
VLIAGSADLLAAPDGREAVDLVEEDDGGLAAPRLLEQEPVVVLYNDTTMGNQGPALIPTRVCLLEGGRT